MLYGIKTLIRNTKFGNKIVDSILKSRYSDILYKFFDKLNLTDASQAAITKKEERKKANIFFKENKEKTEKILSILNDEKSKEIFKKMILYRSSLNQKDLPPYCLNDEYFPKDIIKLSDCEVFTDCGAYDGDTIMRFIKETNGKYKQIIAFEPDTKNFNTIKKNNFKNCCCFKLGLWNEKKTLNFYEDGSASSKLVQTNAVTTRFENKRIEVAISLEAIDNIKECTESTFIKMDIEGAELNALKGARKTIYKNRPKLAICIYHADNDMLDIPLWIHGLNLGYKLYVRQHFGGCQETVLYAI